MTHRVNQHNGNPHRTDANKARLDAWRNRLIAKSNSLDARARQLNDQAETLEYRTESINKTIASQTRETEAWAARQKEHNYRMRQLETRERNVRLRIQMFIKVTPLLEDLKKREELSRRAAAMSSLTEAHRILQHVWDGARLNP